MHGKLTEKNCFRKGILSVKALSQRWLPMLIITQSSVYEYLKKISFKLHNTKQQSSFYNCLHNTATYWSLVNRLDNAFKILLLHGLDDAVARISCSSMVALHTLCPASSVLPLVMSYSVLYSPPLSCRSTAFFGLPLFLTP